MITVYTGPMFSGKSTALIQKYNEIKETGQRNLACFKPSRDVRDLTKIRARNVDEKLNAFVIDSFEGLRKWLLAFENEKVKITDIFLDEAQFLNGDYRVLLELSLEREIDIYIAGLCLTNELKPFGQMPYIIVNADQVIWLTANCECGEPAIYTHCKIPKTENILVGSNEYKPVCKKCWLKYNKL